MASLITKVPLRYYTQSDPRYWAIDNRPIQDVDSNIDSLISQVNNLISTGVPGLTLYTGTGHPEGIVTAGIGALYINTAGGKDGTFFYKETGTSTTGWSAGGYAPLGFSQVGATITTSTTLVATQNGQTFEVSAGIITLPTAALGLRFRFIGTGAGTGVIACVVGSSIFYPDNSSIAAGVNSPAIAALDTIEIICDGTNWLVFNTSGHVTAKTAISPNQAVPLGQADGRYTPIAFTQVGAAITAATTLTSAQNGIRFPVSAPTAVYNISLPPPVSGLTYEFIGLNGAFAVGLVYTGPIILPDGTTVAAGTFSQVSLSEVGNAIRVVCDGTNWYLQTLSGRSISRSATAPNQTITKAQADATYVTETSATGSALLPHGTTAQRDASPVFGSTRANSDLTQTEWWNGAAWVPMGGGATGAPGNYAFFENDIAITANYTITTNKNAMTAGPITINTGVVVTVPTGSVWSII